MAAIYRAVSGGSEGAIKYPHPESKRIPKNIPYIVDNLWAWARPPEYADRRQCAYGSRSPEGAQSAGQGEVFALEFLGEHKICQLCGYGDAKNHPDVVDLKEAAFQALGGYDWSNRSLGEKTLAGRLYMPGLTAEEVETVLIESGLTEEDKKALNGSIHFWEDVACIEPEKPFPDSDGEIFFTYGGGYVLKRL